jgi:hypothetical protein
MQSLERQGDILLQIYDLLGKTEEADKLKAERQKRETRHTEEFKSTHENALFASVGQALSLWAQMEESLVVIAGLLLRARFTKVGVVMYSIINFNVWLSVIDELFALDSIYGSLKPKWNKINERLRRLKDTRDRLAHHSVHSGAQVRTILGDSALKPGRLDSRRKSLKHEPLDFDQVSAFIASVANVLEDLTALINTMNAMLDDEPSPQKPSEQGSDQSPPLDAQ